MTECNFCKSLGTILVKLKFEDGIKTMILCQEHLDPTMHLSIKPIIIEEVSAITDPQKFQAEVTKLVQEMMIAN